MSGNKLVIRSVTESDLEAAFKLMAELGYPNLSRADFAQTYDSVLKDPSMTLIVGEAADGEVVALASISRRPQLRLSGDLITVDELVVAGRVRGTGVGRAILDHVKAMARDARAHRLELETSRSRESYRRAFYIKNGFIEADSAVMRIDYTLPDDAG